MAVDDFQSVAGMIVKSRVWRAIASVVDAARVALPRSVFVGQATSLRRKTTRAGLVMWIRLTGVVLIVATLTHAVLSLLVPPLLRPALSPILRIDVLALALVLVAAAPELEQAWRWSRLRRLVRSPESRRP